MATEQEILSFRNTVEDIRREIGKEIIGQQDVVEHMIMALVAGGNVLLERRAGFGQNAAGAHAVARAGSALFAHPVYARSDACRYHRHQHHRKDHAGQRL